jgi:hypothetical protein
MMAPRHFLSVCPREGWDPSPAGATWNRPEMGPRLRGGAQYFSLDAVT